MLYEVNLSLDRPLRAVLTVNLMSILSQKNLAKVCLRNSEKSETVILVLTSDVDRNFGNWVEIVRIENVCKEFTECAG